MFAVAGGILLVIALIAGSFYVFDALDARRHRKEWEGVQAGNEMRRKLGYHV